MIRTIEHVAIGDAVIESIENIVWEQDIGYITIECDPNSVELISALQKNECLYAQTSDGTYRVQYFCSFRNLVPECSSSVRRVTLGLKNVSFHRGSYLAVME